jgi:hypothetical protein
MKKCFYIIMLALVICTALHGQLSFTLEDLDLPEVYLGDAVWSDFNNSGYLDLLITGYTYGAGNQAAPLTKIYRNEGDGTFTDMNAGLFDLGVSRATVGDLNNNGFNDIVMFGYTGLGGDVYFKMYYNNGDETFTEVVTDFPPMYRGDLALGDFNNDGLLDILISAEEDDTGDAITSIFLNNGDGTFSDLDAGLTPVTHSGIALGDLNNNGYLDLVITGRVASFTFEAYIYFNNGDGTYTQSDQEITGLRYASAALTDYNNDGFKDILISGSDNFDYKHTIIYRNNGDETFTDIDAGLAEVRQGDAIWGDFNNDGSPDVMLTGEVEGGWTTKLYLQTGVDIFTETALDFTAARRSILAPADFNNNGKLDVLLVGWSASQDYLAELYQNQIPTSHIPAEPPTGLFSAINDSVVTLNWEHSNPGTTPVNGLTYNIRIGTSSGESDIVSPQADSGTGFRRIAGPGKYTTNSGMIQGLDDGVYYWSLQAIDHIYSGSQFSAEAMFVVGDLPDPTEPPLLLSPANEADDLASNVNLQWQAVDNAVYYTLQLSADEDFDEITVEHNLALTSYWVHNLEFDADYFWRVSSSNGSYSSAWSEIRTFSTISDLVSINSLTADVFAIDNVLLEWIQPTSADNGNREEISGYKIYRNNNLIGQIDDPDLLSFTDEGLGNGDHDYHVTVLYGTDIYGGLYESIASNVETVTIYLIPPQNITAETGNQLVHLLWEGPDFDSQHRELIGYNVYRNDNLQNQTPLVDTEYQDTNVINGTAYTYYVRTVYSGGLSEPSAQIIAAPSIPPLYPPLDLSASLEGYDVNLNWYSFTDGEWFSHDNGMNSGGIGTNDAIQFEVAARFEPQDLDQYGGLWLEYVSFFPREHQALYSVRVWQGGSIDGDDYNEGDLLIDQALTTADLTIGSWTIVQLETPIMIDATQELWIGYHINTQTGYPAGRDAGPAIVNKGDLVNIDGWESLYQMNPNLNYNWNIQGFVNLWLDRESNMAIPLGRSSENFGATNNPTLSDQSALSAKSFACPSRNLTGYNVYRNGNLYAEIDNIEHSYYVDELTSSGIYHYYVTSLYEGGESPSSNIETIIFTSVEEVESEPLETRLRQNYPNPFNPETTISFSIAEDGYTELTVYDIKGRRVASLLNESLKAGHYQKVWNAQSNKGKEIPAGVYFYRLGSGENSIERKMLLLK